MVVDVTDGRGMRGWVVERVAKAGCESESRKDRLAVPRRGTIGVFPIRADEVRHRAPGQSD